MDDISSYYYYVMSCNTFASPYTECLHDAVLENSMNMLDRLVYRTSPRTNVNCKNFFGDTPLFTALKSGRSDVFIVRLLQAGCSINEMNEKLMSPLHFAVKRRSLLVAHEMIKRGANVNALDEFMQTPLQYALRHGALQAVHLLLYYGADTSNVSTAPGDFHPILDKSVTMELLDAFEQIYIIRKQNSAPYDQDFAVTLRTYPWGVYSSQNVPMSYYAVGCNTDLPFLMIWSNLEHQVLLNNAVPFLLVYMRKCRFPSAKWLEGLYILLRSHSGSDLISDFRSSRYCEMWNFDFIPEMLLALDERKVNLQERVAIVSLCIDLGATVDIAEVNWVIQRYGFKEEMDALIKGVTYHIEHWNLDQPIPMTVFALALDNPNMRPIYKLLKDQIRSTYAPHDVVRALGYFVLPGPIKDRIVELCKNRFGSCPPMICAKLNDIPEIPSLLELSRNMTRTFIKYNYEVHIPSQFHDVVNSLPLPRIIKDIIRFKVPLY